MRRTPVLLALLVLVALSLAAISLVGSALDADDAARAREATARSAPSTPDASVAPTETETETEPAPQPSAVVRNPTRVVDPALGPATFASESGNIRCRADVDGVTCTQMSIRYAPPAEMCVSSAIAAAVRVSRGALQWPCVDASYPAEPVLPYDTDYRYGAFTCTIQRGIGITCTDPDGVGFIMSVDTGIHPATQ